jgi:hypothetical protein
MAAKKTSKRSRSSNRTRSGSKSNAGSRGRSSARKTSSRKYGTKASQKVEKAMRERKRGTLRSGGSGKKVTSRKQAIAIGLSQARRAGGKVPAKRKSRSRG